MSTYPGAKEKTPWHGGRLTEQKFNLISHFTDGLCNVQNEANTIRYYILFYLQSRKPPAL